ncbi:hypothetical protein [Terriglobus sp. TAA 43]|uniref:hypothetical protein n=1 Tax=Terriglobus sp. TAA 43 TaxID=278961 RepID=UPI000645BB88|nr:hypothetical protein [Terriglobus sp. TAA 43]
MASLRTVLAVLIAFSPVVAAAQKENPALRPYESCSFPDGLSVTDVQPMPPDVRDRPAKTKQGEKSVPLLAGRRITFAYPGADPYVSVKVELLPPDNYALNKRYLLEDFDDIVASDKGVAKNTTRPARISAFNVTGLDRKAIAGNTLGIYMLMDDATHVVSTIYLLNPKQSHIKTIEDYTRQRDTFLYNYTRCIRNNQNGVLFGVSK